MLTVRRAIVDDAAGIAWAHAASRRWSHRDLVPGESPAATPEREAAWRERLAGAGRVATFVLDDDDRIVGFACVGSTRDGDAPPGTAELYLIYLLEQAAGQGLGRVLHDHSLGWLREAGFARVTLWVLEANARARGFYEHLGWVADGTTQLKRALTELRYARDL